MKIGDVFALAYRNANASFIAIGSSILLIWALYQMASAPALVDREKINAVVVKASVSKDNSRAFVELQLSDNKICKAIVVNKLYPVVGNSMPIILESYDNDTKRCSIDHDKWKTDYYLYYR